MPEMLGACFHTTRVCDAVFSPDGRRVLTRTDGNEAYLWDYEQARLTTPPLAHAGRVRHVCYSPDGKSVATASADGSACVWDAATGARRYTLKHDGPLTWVEFHPDGDRIVTAAEDRTVRMWSAADGTPLDWRLPVESVLDSLAFSPDGWSPPAGITSFACGRRIPSRPCPRRCRTPPPPTSNAISLTTTAGPGSARTDGRC